MLPLKRLDTMRNEQSEEVAWSTLIRLFEESPEEFQQYLMEEFAKRANGGTSGPPETEKMAQMQNLTGKLGKGY